MFSKYWSSLGAIKLSTMFLSQSSLLLINDNTIVIVFHRLELIWVDLNNTSGVDKQYYACVDFETEVRRCQEVCPKSMTN